MVEKQLDGRGGKADEGKADEGKSGREEKARQNCRALFHGISPDC